MQNGLYNIRVESGGRSVNGGIVMMRDGSILGGDAFFYYVGNYSAVGAEWTGELVTRQHTRSADAVQVFGGADVKVSLSGNAADRSVEGRATVADLNKDFRLTLRLIADL